MKKVLAIVMALTMVLSLGVVAFADDEADFQVGVCQLAPHVALDAATEGFIDALVDAFGEDFEDNIDVQNDGGDEHYETYYLAGTCRTPAARTPPWAPSSTASWPTMWT